MAILPKNSMRRKSALWLRQGTSPQRLALTLSLGFAIGCIPVVGIPTALCAGLALALRLNLPAIQAARAGSSVTLWARDPARAAALATTRENPRQGSNISLE